MIIVSSRRMPAGRCTPSVPSREASDLSEWGSDVRPVSEPESWFWLRTGPHPNSHNKHGRPHPVDDASCQVTDHIRRPTTLAATNNSNRTCPIPARLVVHDSSGRLAAPRPAERVRRGGVPWRRSLGVLPAAIDERVDAGAGSVPGVPCTRGVHLGGGRGRGDVRHMGWPGVDGAASPAARRVRGVERRGGHVRPGCGRGADRRGDIGARDATRGEGCAPGPGGHGARPQAPGPQRQDRHRSGERLVRSRPRGGTRCDWN